MLDAGGEGFISNVIAAIDYAVANKDALHIRIINLSVAARVYRVLHDRPVDPGGPAARSKPASSSFRWLGIDGRRPDGTPQFASIGAPGNAPWVLTVGASSHNGTVDRSDDVVAAFSSRGPTAIDVVAKPDLVAPGVGIESLADPTSTLFDLKPHDAALGHGGNRDRAVPVPERHQHVSARWSAERSP